MQLTDYFQETDSDSVRRGEMGDVFLWALNKMREEKASRNTSVLTKDEYNALCILPLDLPRFLDAEYLELGPAITAGRFPVFQKGSRQYKGSTPLASSYEYPCIAVLEVSWLRYTAPFLGQEWPLWAANSTSGSLSDRLLAAVGKYFLAKV